MSEGKIASRFGSLNVVQYKNSDYGLPVFRWSHLLADNEQMRSHAKRVEANFATQDRTPTWPQSILAEVADECPEIDQARRNVEWAAAKVPGSMRSLQQYRQAEVYYRRRLTRLACMLVSDVPAGNIPNPITVEIERAVDELVRLCRVAGQLEADLTLGGKKRHMKAELKRINEIVDREKNHLLDGIAAIRESNKSTQ